MIVDSQEVCRGGEGDCDAGGFGGNVWVVALPMGEGIELCEEGGVGEAGEFFYVLGGGSCGEVWLAVHEVLEEAS